MEYIKNINLEKIKKQKIGFLFFYLGIFLLPSAFFIASISLLTASIYGCIYKKEKYFSDKWNKLLFLSGCIMVINSILQKFFFENNFEGIWDPNLTIIGLGNWLPLFWIFWALQPYLEGEKNRKVTALILISGSFPVLFTGFAGLIFKLEGGPYETLNGLITWYIDGGYGTDVFTGLFTNPNYAGSWLTYIWPFSLAIFLDQHSKKLHKFISLLLLICVGLGIILTNSRNAWGSLFFSIPIMLGMQTLAWVIPFYLILGAIIFIAVSNFFQGELQNLIRSIIPQKIWLEFSQKGFTSLDSTRLEIFFSALNLSLLRPIFGIGAASFSAIYFFQSGFWKGHSHNLFIELAISYGFPVAIVVLSTIITLIVISFRKIFTSKSVLNQVNYFERAWWTSAFCFLISQLFDIQYFDGKISVLFWILLAGIKNLHYEKKENLFQKN